MDSSSKKRRRRILIALAVAVWLLMLGFISYCVCLPDLGEVSASLRAIREDPNLTPEQKFEKSREIFSKLSPGQARRVFQSDFKKWHYERNQEMQKFLKMSPEDQLAYVKKMEEEGKKFGPPGGISLRTGGKEGKGGPVGLFKPSAGGRSAPFIFFGAGGVKPTDPSQLQKTMLDDISPETRAGMSYQRGLSRR